MKISTELEFVRGKLWALINLIRTYLKIDLDSAKVYMAEANNLIQSVENGHLIGALQLNKSRIHEATGQIDLPFMCANLCLDLAIKHDLADLQEETLD